MMDSSASLTADYAHCQRIVRGHYENFPVASIALPRRLRPHVAAVYAFARHADDLADEGSRSTDERLRLLDAWREELHRCTRERSALPEFRALGDTLLRFSIPVQLFDDLLDAFAQDVVKHSYATYDEVLDYCRRSANPVGRIVLALFSRLDERSGRYSDAICTALQLTNFWQDVSVDRLKPRVYIPLEDLHRHGVREQDVLEGRDSPALRECIAFQLRRTRELFREGTGLFDHLPLRLRMEVRAVWQGGVSILEKISALRYNVVSIRPTLTFIDHVRMLRAAMRAGAPHV
ncbi:MAG TPA: squalene synthase HpnC [Bacteroidota bacterium]|nr:squalene synthase HpnC [Bacteroidota bacterium]